MRPTIPGQMHLALDVVMGVALMLSPCFLPASGRRYAAVPMGLGAIGLLMAFVTETGPADFDEGFRPSRELSEAVGHR